MNETMERNQMVQAYRALSTRDRILFQTILDLVVVLIGSVQRAEVHTK